MSGIGSDGVVNRANTSTGFAIQVNAETYLDGGIGQGVGGSGMSTTYPVKPSILLEYLAVQDSDAIPNDIFNTQYSVNLGNNSGWTFV